MKMEEYMESEFSRRTFLSETGRQKYCAWVLGDPTLNCLCSVMYLYEELYKCSEPESYTLPFSLSIVH